MFLTAMLTLGRWIGPACRANSQQAAGSSHLGGLRYVSLDSQSRNGCNVPENNRVGALSATCSGFPLSDAGSTARFAAAGSVSSDCNDFVVVMLSIAG